MRRIAAGLLVVAMLFLGSPASAGSDVITYGDVVSHFNAWTTGGRVIFFGNDTPAVVNAGPADVFGGGIRPFPDSPWDGAAYCVEDWHVVLLSFIDGGDESFKHKDAVASLAGIEVEWVLDGDVLTETERTPIKRYLAAQNLGVDVAFAFQDGSFLAPDDLGVGSHTLLANISDPLSGDETIGPITFSVDPLGVGACL